MNIGITIKKTLEFICEFDKRRFSGYVQNGVRFGEYKGRISAYTKQNIPFSNFLSQ